MTGMTNPDNEMMKNQQQKDLDDEKSSLDPETNGELPADGSIDQAEIEKIEGNVRSNGGLAEIAESQHSSSGKRTSETEEALIKDSD